MKSVATRAGEWGCLRRVLDQLAAVDPERLFGTGGASLTGVSDYRYSDVVRAYCLAARSNADKKKQLCLAWLGGETLARDECKFLGVRSLLDCSYVVVRLLDFARVVRLAGCPGVLLVLKGTESIQQLRADVRELNQYALVNLWNRLHSRERYGCLVVLAGTDDSIRNHGTGLHVTAELRHLLVDSRDVFDSGPWAR
ncbi:BREX system ATP-binding domain-containing protein [Acidovorax sacchari]|uniref:BREX system ATP-binding domain-containing protein n=1 Tax=Acidovorax sacchari TaxID=3230736 RepID=UPI0039E4F88D